jgi:hypothetical protein
MNADAKSKRCERGGGRKSLTRVLQVPTTAVREKRQPSCQSHPVPEKNPVLDERVPTLLIGAIRSVTAAIASANMKLTYREAHQAMAVNFEEKRELTNAIQEIVDKHPAFFTENKAAIEFGIDWAGLHGAKFDIIFAITDDANTVERAALSPGEALFVALLVFAPLAIFAVVSLVQHLRRV